MNPSVVIATKKKKKKFLNKHLTYFLSNMAEDFPV